MKPHLAIEWDATEVRLATAHQRAGRTVLDDVWTIPLTERSGDRADTPSAAVEIGQRIARSLDDRDLGRPPTLVTVARSRVQLKALTLPPTPVDELPTMVGFRARDEMHGVGDGGTVDYLHLKGDETHPHEVLAAAISPETLADITATCRAAELKLVRLVLRPCATASLVVRMRPPKDEHPRLVVDALAREAELTVLDGRQVVFMRTVRLPEPDDDGISVANEARLAAEIRRTLAAIEHQMPGKRAAAIDRSVGIEAHGPVDPPAAMPLPVHPFNPLAGVKLSSGLQASKPRHAGRFAPLVGMLIDELQCRAPIIDFLQPRRGPVATKHRARWLLGATAAALLAAATTWQISQRLERLDQQIAHAEETRDGLDLLVESSRPTTEKVARLDRWMATDIVWLDELSRLAEKLPEPPDAMITQLQLLTGVDSASLSVEGRTREHHLIDQFEANLRDVRHHVAPKTSHHDNGHPQYGWQFATTVAVARTADQSTEDDAAHDTTENSESVKSESVNSESAKIESAKIESAKIESAKIESANGEMAKVRLSGDPSNGDARVGRPSAAGAAGDRLPAGDPPAEGDPASMSEEELLQGGREPS